MNDDFDTPIAFAVLHELLPPLTFGTERVAISCVPVLSSIVTDAAAGSSFAGSAVLPEAQPAREARRMRVSLRNGAAGINDSLSPYRRRRRHGHTRFRRAQLHADGRE